MPSVEINHPHTKYTVNCKFKAGSLCSVELSNGLFRILHINTGISFGEFRWADEARTLVQRIHQDKFCKDTFKNLSWLDYKEKTDLFLEAKRCVYKNVNNLNLVRGEESKARFADRVQIL